MRLSAWLLVAFLGIGSIPAWAGTDDQAPAAQVQQLQSAPQPQASPRGDDSLRAKASSLWQTGPNLGLMIESMISAKLKFYAQPETANAIAAFTRNYYDALIKRGFTEEQALKIVSTVGVPSMSGY